MKKYILVILSLIIFIGALLRLNNLVFNSIWFDEASNILNALKSYNFIFRSPFNYKPVYIYLLKGWISIFGINAFACRFSSIVFGIFSIALIFRIGRNIFNDRIGLIASFLLAISSFHLYHCRQVGPEVFLSFLTLLSFDYFISFLKQKKIHYLIVNLLMNILLIYSYPFGFLVMLSQAVFIFYRYRLMERKLIGDWLLSLILLILVSLPLLMIIVKHKNYFKSILWWATPPILNNVSETFVTFSSGWPKYGLTETIITITFYYPAAVILSLIFLIFFLVGIFKIAKRILNAGANNFSSLVIIWLFLPLLVSFSFSYIFFPVYFIRKFIFLLPAFYLIIAVGLNFKRIVSLLIILIIIFLLNIPAYNMMYNKNFLIDWRKAVSLMKQKGIKDDATIIVTSGKEVVPFMYYFSDCKEKDLEDIGMFGKLIDDKWCGSFLYKKHLIVTLPSEYFQLPVFKPGILSRLNQYDCDYFIRELNNKFFETSFFDPHKQICLFLSRWSGLDNDCVEKILNKFKEFSDIKFAGGTGEVKTFIFNETKHTR